jgi:hypothetical protein
MGADRRHAIAPGVSCAHCIVSTAVATVIEAMIGTSDIPEVTITMPTAPGITHRVTNLNAYTDEVANARIYAGLRQRRTKRPSPAPLH